MRTTWRKFIRWSILILFVALSALGIAILTGAWTILPDGCPPDCSGADLRDKDLREVDLGGLRSFHGADLSGAILNRADLSGVDLAGADLSGATLDRASLEKTNLTQALLKGADLEDASLIGARLAGADLSGANLSGATLTEVDLASTLLKAAVLEGATLIGVNLADVDLGGANLSDADLRGADLSGATLSGADLSGADLSGATLTNAIMNGATLVDANLVGTSMVGARMNGVSICGTEGAVAGIDLSGADLSGADLFGAELAGAKLYNAILDRATLISARLYGVDLRQASLGGTKLWVSDLSVEEYEVLKQRDPDIAVEDVQVYGYEIDDKVASLASGEITLLTSMPQAVADKIAADFRAKFPWITLHVYRVETSRVVDILTGGDLLSASQADLVWVAEPSVYEELKELDMLREYYPPDLAFLSPQLNDPERTYYAGRLINSVIAYNADVEIVPEDWEDLLDPFYRGRVGWVDPLVAGSAWPSVQALVNAYSWSYFEELAANEPVMVPDNATMYDLLARGDLMAGILLDYRGREAIEQGDPIGHVWPEVGVISIPSPIAILSQNENLLASQIFVDYVLSRDGQETMVKLGNFVPVRLDVASPPGAPALGDIRGLPTDWKVLMKNRDQLEEQWRAIFDK